MSTTPQHENWVQADRHAALFTGQLIGLIVKAQHKGEADFIDEINPVMDGDNYSSEIEVIMKSGQRFRIVVEPSMVMTELPA